MVHYLAAGARYTCKMEQLGRTDLLPTGWSLLHKKCTKFKTRVSVFRPIWLTAAKNHSQFTWKTAAESNWLKPGTCAATFNRSRRATSVWSTTFETAADRTIDSFPAPHWTIFASLDPGGAVNILMTIVENSPSWPHFSYQLYNVRPQVTKNKISCAQKIVDS